MVHTPYSIVVYNYARLLICGVLFHFVADIVLTDMEYWQFEDVTDINALFHSVFLSDSVKCRSIIAARFSAVEALSSQPWIHRGRVGLTLNSKRTGTRSVALVLNLSESSCVHVRWRRITMPCWTSQITIEPFQPSHSHFAIVSRSLTLHSAATTSGLGRATSSFAR